jgi:hypothetical protein
MTRRPNSLVLFNMGCNVEKRNYVELRSKDKVDETKCEELDYAAGFATLAE